MNIELKFITWNIDGLGTHMRTKRAKSASEEILAQDPDVINLQEVVASDGSNVEEIFDTAFCADQYIKFCPNSYTVEYFTVTYIKKCWASTAVVRRQQFSGSATSMMGRDILCVICNIQGVSLMVVNAHLESMKDFTAPRTSQLEEICKLMLKHPGPAIVGGDLNMRDKEQKIAFSRATGGNEKAMVDAYEFFGKPKDARVTWELPDQPMAKGRFDRIYHNQKGIKFIQPSIIVLGDKLISGLGTRPSDHVGLQVSVRLVKPCSPVTQPSVSNKKHRLHESIEICNEEFLHEKPE